MQDLLAALSLVAVLEGLMLFAAPDAWRRTVIQLLAAPPVALRRLGALVMGAGLVALWWVRH